MNVKIKKFEYPNGTPYWLVSCTIPGRRERYRKKHPTQAEAFKDRARLMGSVASSIRVEELDEAKAAILKLRNATNTDAKDKSIIDAVEYFIANYSDPSRTLPISEYVKQFLQLKRDQKLRPPTLHELERFLNQFAEDFKGRSIHDISTPEILNNYLTQTNRPNKNRVATLNQFFNYLAGTAQTANREHPVLKRNPLRLIPKGKVDQRDLHEIKILSVEETRQILIEAAKHNAQRMFLWLLFTGMRPTETVKFWAETDPWSKINIRKGLISVSGTISKTRTNRHIRIKPNLKLWLEHYQGQSFYTRNWRDKFCLVKKILPPETRKVNDICRHTFISYLSSNATWQEIELQAGNSKEIQLKHYLALLPENAAEYWEITPASINTFDISEEDYARQGTSNRRNAILQNRARIRHKKNGQPLIIPAEAGEPTD